MKNILWVPIRTDALFLSEDTLVTEATADFSHLPFFNGERDVNSDVANVSENIVSQPLQDQNLRLRKGLHLHWALPDAMNRGRHLENGKTEFPAVPNRWLVTRKMNDEEKSWVVESDYLYPEDKDIPADSPLWKARRESITVPVETGGRESGEQPFRYMGRKLEADQYAPNDNAQSYLGPKIDVPGPEKEKHLGLTTIGYGEPSFAAFYPNCHSVFGFHDPDIGEDMEATYDIIGWYSEDEQDFFETLTKRKVHVTFQSFSANLPQYSEAQVEELWEKLLILRVLTKRGMQDSTAEEAWVSMSPDKWEVPKEFEFVWPKELVDAVEVLRQTFDQHIQERTGWQLQPVVSQSDLDDLISQASDVTVNDLQEAGWLVPVTSMPGYFTVVKDSDRPKESQEAFDDPERRLQAEKIILNLRLGRTPKRVLVYSKIEVNTNGQTGELLQEEAQNISVTIGNTGTEALSTYLAEQLKMFPKLKVHFDEETFEEQLSIVDTETAPQTIAEQLEALYLLDKLDHRILDADAKFDEARHENGFNALASGHHWTITVTSQKNQQADAHQTTKRPELPAELAKLLGEINALQWEYDRNRARLDSLGTQLYADWYKYMLSTYPPQDTRTDYPDIDEVRYFIETEVMKDIQELHDNTGLLKLVQPEDIRQGTQPASGTGGHTTATAKVLARKLNQLHRDLMSLNDDLPEDSDQFMLQRTGGPRYYQPKEPVVLLANEAADNSILQPTRRHGQDGQLVCHIFRLENDSRGYLKKVDSLLSARRLAAKLIEIRAKEGAGNNETVETFPGFTQWSGQPWNPFRLEWEVELVPLSKGTNLEDRDYAANLIQQSFDLDLNAPDLNTDEVRIATYQGRNPNIYLGKSLLTPQAKRNLNERLRVYLEEKIPHEDLDKIIGNPKRTRERVAVIGDQDSLTATALLAYSHLRNDDLHILSQAFSGFNDAMLQLRQSYQLPIADPIGFKDYQPFTEQVAELAKRSAHLAPQPLTDFNPIRTGEMVINQLRLVDTFGQKIDIELDKLDRVLGGEKAAGDNNSVIEVPLQPRLAQPARLNFRWLSAQLGEQEMNAVPSSSPICGWILTNQLDDSLVIYDRAGRMLGSIEAEPDPDDESLARWNSAPGALYPVSPETVENEFLRKMVAKIRSGGKEYVGQFIDGLDQVLRSIEPENFENQQAMSLLIGRPVALVRASINLELQGDAAVDQGWYAFYQDRTDGDSERNRDKFTEVKFPVRLGKHEQFNDGLVGYWVENENENSSTDLSDEFYLNSTELPLENGTTLQDSIKLLDDDDIPIRQAIAEDPHLVSMLIDPRAKVHATTGILPVKEIDLPAEQYLPAMQQMAVTFLTAPLLSPAANVQSLLPTVEGYKWSWIEAKGKVKPPTYIVIEKAAFAQALINGILAHLQERNWIVEVDEGFFHFLSDEEPLEGQFSQLDTDLFGIIEEISTEEQHEERGTVLVFTESQFVQKISNPQEPVGKAWNLLVRSDVTWCRYVPDHPDVFEVLPFTDRSSDELPELGLGKLVNDILAEHQKEMEIPSTLDPTSPEAIAKKWREVFTYPTIGREEFQQGVAEGILAYLMEHGWIETEENSSLFIADGPPLEGQFQLVEEDLFGLLEFISTAPDERNRFPFSRREFLRQLTDRNGAAGRAWNKVLEFGWCKPVADWPDRLEVVPLAKRTVHELEGLGLEFLVESILVKHQQVLTEPAVEAQFSDARLTIREGYLKLERTEQTI